MHDGSGEVDGETREVRLWDPALRLFHWLLAAAFVASWTLGEFGPDIMTWHFWSGYLIAALLAFRLVWGIAGPRTARFGAFLAGPGSVIRYIRTLGTRRPSHWPGHNPLGGWAVAAMLVLLAAQVATGLVSDPEDYVNVGPLAGYVADDTARAATAWHDIIATLLLALAILHVGVVILYRLWKREDLVGPMIHGRKRVRAPGPPAGTADGER